MRVASGRRLRSQWILAGLALLSAGLVAVGVALVGYHRLAAVVDEKFAGRRWDFPSSIYSDEFLLHVGLDVDAAGVRRRLARLGYRPTESEPRVGGEFRSRPDALEVALRPGARGREQTQRVRLVLDGPRVVKIVDLDRGEEIAAAALEPEEITGIYEGEWEQREVVRVVDVAPILVRAILVAEDSRFFDHHGIDLMGIARAAWANLRSGRVRQGGSTLTQQLMKNFFLTTDRTLARKLREAAMALVAERRYSKMQILENYLNEIYLGQRSARGIFGVAEAAHFYFGKDPKDLSLAEVALIAGLVRAPNAYSPLQSPERALAQRNTVLRMLLDAGEIERAQYDEARQSPLGVVRPVVDQNEAPYFVDLVKAELAGRFPADVLATEGLRIYTTLDPVAQEQANVAVAGGLDRLEREFPGLRRGRDRLEAALVALKPHTGEIKALVGGRSYQLSQFDRATQARRQPGSAFKPIVYLAGLLATGPGHITPATILDDSPFTWLYDGEREWTPHNDGGRYHGPVTTRTALEKSLNAATARVAQGVGLPAIVALARTLGWAGRLPAVPSVVLGSAEVSPLELTAMYATLASGGARAESIAIRRVESRRGEMVAGQPPTMSSAIPPEDAYVLTHLLEGVLDRGTAHAARDAGFDRPAAGKTGTTNDLRDAWFVGFTPDLVAGVWVGFDRRRPLGLTGARAALPIWVDFMRHATAAEPPRAFPRPPGVALIPVERTSGRPVEPGAGSSPAEIIEEAFRLTDVPPPEGGAGSEAEPREGPPGALEAPATEEPPDEPGPQPRVALGGAVGD